MGAIFFIVWMYLYAGCLFSVVAKSFGWFPKIPNVWLVLLFPIMLILLFWEWYKEEEWINDCGNY